MRIEFSVIDNYTGRYPNCELIAVTEEWAKHLMRFDIDCFAINEDGNLILTDDCGNVAYPPADRFTVTVEPKTLRPQGRWHKLHGTKLTKTVECTRCNWGVRFKKEGGIVVDLFPYCPNCGAYMKGAETDA